MVMGRNGYGPKWSWAEMVMGRNDPESAITKALISCMVTASLFSHMQKADLLMTRFTCSHETEQINCVFESRHEKTNILVSDLVRHKQDCTVTENGCRL